MQKQSPEYNNMQPNMAQTNLNEAETIKGLSWFLPMESKKLPSIICNLK